MWTIDFIGAFRCSKEWIHGGHSKYDFKRSCNIGASSRLSTTWCLGWRAYKSWGDGFCWLFLGYCLRWFIFNYLPPLKKKITLCVEDLLLQCLWRENLDKNHGAYFGKRIYCSRGSRCAQPTDISFYSLFSQILAEKQSRITIYIYIYT